MEIHAWGRTFKEICTVAEVNEKKVRNFIRTINTCVPNKTKIVHNDTNYISRIANMIVNNLEKKTIHHFSLERLAEDILNRAFRHECVDSCPSLVVSGKRPSTLACASIWIAAKKLGVCLSPDDLAACGQIGKDTMFISVDIINGHFAGMYDTESREDEQLISSILKHDKVIQ